MLSVLFPFVFAGTFVFIFSQAFRMMSRGFNTQSVNRSSLSSRCDRTGLLTTHPELLDQHGDFVSEELLVVRFPELGGSEPTPA